ncbi:MAG: hypothetical protein HY752_04010 [Nitrospirae bacterium]|nr:hypothetical protein [Nitrospirota bacterium]
MITRRLKKNKRIGFIKVGWLLYMFASIFTIIWLRTAVFNLEYKVWQLQKDKDTVMRERKLTSAERVSLSAMKRMEEVAIKDFGMGPPKRENVFFVKKIQGPRPYEASTKSASELASSQ